MMIMSNVNRNVSFTMAASSYSKPVIGQLAKLLKVIPVHRPEDHKKKSAGKLVFESSKELKVKIKIKLKLIKNDKLNYKLSNAISISIIII
jgi:1-acyl-sn-glycerol-3-phosphate acyltransferase